MKLWTINVEEIDKYLKKEDPENYYLIESRDTIIEIYVNDLMDKDFYIWSKDVLKTLEVDRYTINVYTTAEGEELKKQLKNILFAIHFTSEIQISVPVIETNDDDTAEKEKLLKDSIEKVLESNSRGKVKDYSLVLDEDKDKREFYLRGFIGFN